MIILDQITSKTRCQCGQILDDDLVSSHLKCSKCGWVFSPARWICNERKYQLGYFDIIRAKEMIDRVASSIKNTRASKE